MQPLNSLQLTAYAAPAIILSMLTMALIVYIPPFYATEVGMNLATVGIVFFVARAWDAVIDPLLGYCSDRTVSRWGKRKPWVIIGCPLLIITTYLLFQPKSGIGAGYLWVWVFLFYFSWTVVQIPYLSWGAELSGDYRERNRIVGYREGAMFVGVLLATALPLIVFFNKEPTLRDILKLFAFTTLIVMPLATFFSVMRCPAEKSVISKKVTLKETLALICLNLPFLRLQVVFFLLWLGLHIYNASVLFILEYSLQLPKSVFLKLVFIQFAVGIAFVPILIKLANRLGKHRTLAISGICLALSLPLLMLIPPGNFIITAIIFAIFGITISPIWVLPTALVADAVDFGVLKGGGEQAGVYLAIYNFVVKLALAGSAGIALPLMAWLGFDPSTDNGPGEILRLNLVGLALPGLLYLPAVILLWNYPITKERHEVIQNWIGRKIVRES